jgi:hypothetical protein
MTIERPMFPPLADSVDSSSLQPAIGQPERAGRTSDSLGSMQSQSAALFDFQSYRAKAAAKAVDGDSLDSGDGASAPDTNRQIFRDPLAEYRNNTPTETAKNAALRKERAKRWLRAQIATRYWRIKIDYEFICPIAAKHSIICTPALHVVDDRRFNVRKWREAQVAQLLTPAPTAAAIAWKRKAFARGEYKYINVKPELIARAIELDAAWLAAHPMRRPRPASAQ